MDLKLNGLIKQYSYERWADNILNDRTGELDKYSDRVVSGCFLSLSRNIAGITFPAQCKTRELLTVRNMIKAYFGKAFPSAIISDADKLQALEQGMMFERGFYNHEISKENSGAAFILNLGEPWIYAVVNQDDHLRLVYDDSVAGLWDGWLVLDELDSKISAGLDFAWNRERGYLCSNPTLSGTGLDLTATMQLVGILTLHRYEELIKPLESSIFKLCPIDHVDCPWTETSKTMKFTFNFDRRTSEQQQIYLAETALGIISKYECECREELFNNHQILLADWLERAVALTKNAELVSAFESRYFHSALRFAVVEGLCNRKDIDYIDNQFERLNPIEVLEESLGINRDRYELDHKRAMFLKQTFKSFRLAKSAKKWHPSSERTDLC